MNNTYRSRSRSPVRPRINNTYRGRSDSRSPDSRSPDSRSPDSRSRDRSLSRSYSPTRDGSLSRSMSRSRSYSRSRSPRAESPDNQRSRIKRDRYMKNKFGLYKHQKEYLFPIGIHADIDQSIIEKMDFAAIINLLKIDKSAKLRMLIIKNIASIIENENSHSQNYETNRLTRLIDSLYNLLELRELDILKTFEKPDEIMEEFNRRIDINIEDNKEQIIDYLSILTGDQIVTFIKYILPVIRNDNIGDIFYDIGFANDILDLALELGNDIMIETIKDWFIEHNLVLLTNELKKMKRNLGL